MTLYAESAAYQTNHFPKVFVRKNVKHGYDVMTFESLQSTPFCLEKFSVKNRYFNVLTVFSVRIWLE